MRILPYWLIPVVAFGLTMLAFAEGVFDALPDPPVEAQPGEALAEADRYYRRGEVAIALSHLQRATSAIGETSAILIGIARCHMRLGRLRDAERSLEAAVRNRLTELGHDATRLPSDLDKQSRRALEERGHAAIEQSASANTLPGLSAGVRSGPERVTPEVPPHAVDVAIALKVSDPLIGVALTDFARVELARAMQFARHERHLETRESPAVAAWLPASIGYGDAPAKQPMRSEQHRARAQRYLQAALHHAPRDRMATLLMSRATGNP